MRHPDHPHLHHPLACKHDGRFTGQLPPALRSDPPTLPRYERKCTVWQATSALQTSGGHLLGPTSASLNPRHQDPLACKRGRVESPSLPPSPVRTQEGRVTHPAALTVLLGKAWCPSQLVLWSL